MEVNKYQTNHVIKNILCVWIRIETIAQETETRSTKMETNTPVDFFEMIDKA